MLESSQEKTEPSEIDQLDWLLQRASQGDTDVLPELRSWLDQSGVRKKFGDLGQQARDAWLRLIAGDDLVLRESILRKLDDLKRELAPNQPTATERLLIDRIVANWLQLHHSELAGSQALNKPKLSEFWARRQSRAERSYLVSLSALTTLRRLLSAVTVPTSTTAQRDDSNSTLEGPIEDPTRSGPPLRLVDHGGG
jgi:hypothetical protein